MSKGREFDPHCTWQHMGERCNKPVGFYPPGRSNGYCTLHGFMLQGYSYEQAAKAVQGLEQQIGRRPGESWVDWKARGSR